MSDTLPVPEMQTTLTALKQTMTSEADRIVPWFFANMHEYYFRTHTKEEVLRHLHGIVSGEVTTENRTLMLKSPCGTRVTYITPGTETKDLIETLTSLRNTNLQTARIYASFDNRVRLCTFHQAPQTLTRPDDPHLPEALAELRNLSLVEKGQESDVSRFLTCASLDYIEKFDPHRTARHYRIIREIQDSERVHVSVEPEVRPGQDRISVAMTNPPDTGMLLEVIKILARAGVFIYRGYGDLFKLDEFRTVGIVSLYARCPGEFNDTGSSCWLDLKRELEWVKWLEPGDLEWFADKQNATLAQVALLQSACEFVHQFLRRTNRYAFTLGRIVKTVMAHPDMAMDLVRYFEARFTPHASDREDLVATAEASVTSALDQVPLELHRTIFQEIFRFFQGVLKTNYFVKSRFGLGFRVDPDILKEQIEGDQPYGIFFFHGPSFHGFHVRYRDVARGGVRVVRTKNKEHYELENDRLFDEVTALAASQQYKNKDIPEGGSKAVLLLKPGGSVDLAVKSMTNTLLDLIISSKDATSLPEVIDYLGRHELIYLGPDENILPRHIDWIVERAAQRGYRWAQAFMSSKPGAGINHKEYGVTSLGVIVFMEEVLKTMNIDPHKDRFTVKMTGGPAGDVAGNGLKILMDKFPDTVRIVAVTDGHGAAHDPDGLDHDELRRLIAAGKRIHEFDPGRISHADGFVVSADTPEGAKVRNTLHNTALADVFIPAGGRPDTINAGNWKQFLKEDGTPSAGAIVEGANIFISREARDNLESSGVLFLHGSSANKTGVICSSYEILAGLILSVDEFLAIKNEYVAQVLEILEKRARDEARLLTREYRYAGAKRPMTSISFDASREINDLGDTIGQVLTEQVSALREDPDLCGLIEAYCPAVLVEKYRDRIVGHIPVRHQFALLGAFISSRIVYNEGLGWLRRISTLRDIMEVVHAYLAEEKHLAELGADLEEAGLDQGEIILEIIRRKGQRFLTASRLGLEG